MCLSFRNSILSFPRRFPELLLSTPDLPQCLGFSRDEFPSLQQLQILERAGHPDDSIRLGMRLLAALDTRAGIENEVRFGKKIWQSSRNCNALMANGNWAGCLDWVRLE